MAKIKGQTSKNDSAVTEESKYCLNQICFCSRHPKTETCASLGAFATRLMANNSIDSFPPRVSATISPFNTISAGISVSDYIMRLKTYMCCSDSCFVIAGTYLNRYYRATDGLGVTAQTIHRVLLISVVIAAKYIDDAFYPNSHYAKVGSVSLRSLNNMERHFLDLINYKMHVNEATFLLQVQRQKSALLEIRSQFQSGSIQGWPHYRHSVSTPTTSSLIFRYFNKLSSTSTSSPPTQATKHTPALPSAAAAVVY